MTSTCPYQPNQSNPAANRHGRIAAGFTMVELLVTVTVAAILASLAAPSFSSLIATQRTKSVASNLHLALTIARSEATKRNANVTVAQKAGGWANGWTIFPSATATNILQDYAATRGVTVAATDSGGAATVSATNMLRVSVSPMLFPLRVSVRSDHMCQLELHPAVTCRAAI